MTSRLVEQGKFYDVAILPQVIRETARRVSGSEEDPVITDVFSDGHLFSVCVFRKKIYTFYKTGVFTEEPEPPSLENDPWNYLYFVLTHLQSIGDEQSVRELCPFIHEYDLTKLIQNLQYSILRTYLELVPAKEIPTAALQEPLLTHLFVDAGWTLPLSSS